MKATIICFLRLLQGDFAFYIMVAAVWRADIININYFINFDEERCWFMVTKFTVIESCHPYHELMGGINAREGIEGRDQNLGDSKDYCRGCGDRQELVLAPPINS